MQDKEIYPGKIMYSGFNGTVKPLQFVKHDDAEVDIYYARICYRGESGVEFGGEYKLIGLKYLFHTREEAINYALSELSASIAKLPSIDELRDLEMSAQPARYDLSNVFE